MAEVGARPSYARSKTPLALMPRGGRRAVLRELHNRYENLTPREREVLVHVVSGKLNKQIAFDLGTAERTVKAHRASIMFVLIPRSAREPPFSFIIKFLLPASR